MSTSRAALPSRPFFIIDRSTEEAMDQFPGPDVLTQSHLKPIKRKTFMKGEGADGTGTRFRLYDDDGNLHYEGIMWNHYWDDSAFIPLDWGMSYSGTTIMKTKNRNGAWEVL